MLKKRSFPRSHGLCSCPLSVSSIVVLWVVLCVAQAYALDPDKSLHQAVQTNWSTQEGLPQLSVQTIAQTPDGFLWIGTQGGLARFDGHSFINFSKSNTAAFKVNDVIHLEYAPDGTLWIATNGGGLLSMRDGEFRAYTTEQGLVNDIVFRLLVTEKQGLFVGTTDGLSILKDGSFTNYGTKDGLSFKVINDLVQDEKGRVWIGTGKGLNRYENGKIFSDDERGEYPKDVIGSLYVDSHGVLWVGTQNTGLYKRQDGKFKLYNKSAGLDVPFVDDILEDRDGNLWVGVFGGGVCQFKNEHFQCTTKDQGLVENNTNQLFEDKEGSLWVGTNTGGLSQFRDGKFTSYSTLDGLAENNVRTLYEDSSGDLWIGLGSEGLARFQGGEIENFGPEHGLPPKAGVRGLFEDSKRRLWVGTYNAGVYLFEDDRFVKPEIFEDLPSGSVRAFAEDSEGAIWLGVYGKGLFRYRDTQDEPSLERFTAEKEEIASDLILLIDTDSQGALWIGTWGGGLTRYKDGEFKIFTKEKDGLAHDVILSFYEDTDGYLWFGTYGGGLILFKDDTFHEFTVKQGLIDDGVLSVIGDDVGNLWMSSSKGVFKVTRSELLEVASKKRSRVRSWAYDETDGIQARDCNGGSQPSAAASQNGMLWFPTVGGITGINPKKININETPPPLVLEKIIIDEEAVEPSPHIRVEPGAEKIEFHYTSPSFISNEKIVFDYKLEGFDRHWVNAGSRRVAYYTNLNPGQYRFSIRAKNADGVWSAKKTVVSLELVPAFWQTIWFRVALVLSFILLVAGIAFLRIQRIKRANIILEQKVQERTAQLKVAHAKIVRYEKERTENQMSGGFAHEIRNALAGAKMLMRKILFSKVDDSKSPSLAVKNGEHLLEIFKLLKGNIEPTLLKRVTGRIKDITEAEKTMDQLTHKAFQSIERSLDVTTTIMEYSKIGSQAKGAELIDLRELLTDFVEEHRRDLAEKKIQIVADLSDRMFIRGAESHFRSLFSNIVLNARDALLEDTDDIKKEHCIRIASVLKDRWLRISIKDNGTGIPDDVKARIFEPFFSTKPATGTGLGLGMTAKYVSIYDGQLSVNTDPGQWTEFVIELPLEEGPVNLTPQG